MVWYSQIFSSKFSWVYRFVSSSNRELKQETFLTTRTSTGSKFDVFDQSRRLIQSSWRPCCQKRRLLKLSNLSLAQTLGINNDPQSLIVKHCQAEIFTSALRRYKLQFNYSKRRSLKLFRILATFSQVIHHVNFTFKRSFCTIIRLINQLINLLLWNAHLDKRLRNVFPHSLQHKCCAIVIS